MEPPKAEKTRITPMLQQYYQLKNQLDNDTILFFRMGDFYELFDQDAANIAPQLNIVLTHREKGDKTKIPFCGVPVHSYENYLIKLLRLGHKVAIADQFSDNIIENKDHDNSLNKEPPKSKHKILQRKIVKIHTPSSSDLLFQIQSSHQSNYLFGVYECPQSKLLFVCICEYSRGEIKLAILSSFDQLKTYINTYDPQELLVRKFHRNSIKKICFDLTIDDHLSVQENHNFPVISHLPELFFQNNSLNQTIDYLLYQNTNTNVLSESCQFINHVCAVIKDLWAQSENLPIDQSIATITSINHHDLKKNSIHISIAIKKLIGSVMIYYHHIKASIDHFTQLRSLIEPTQMQLDHRVIKDFELLKSLRSNSQRGSLFSIINCTGTAMGARKLVSRLLNPYLDPQSITNSHLIIDGFLQFNQFSQLYTHLQKIYDLQRLATKVKQQNILPKQLAQIRQSLSFCLKILDVLSEMFEQYSLLCSNHPDNADHLIKNHLKKLITDLSLAKKPAEAISLALIEDPQCLGQGDQVLRSGYDQSLDHQRHQRLLIQEQINNYHLELKINHKLNLKIITHRSMGLMIELTKSQIKNVPDSWQLKNSTLNSKRYVTDRLQQLCNQMIANQDTVTNLEKDLYQQFLSKFNQNFYQNLVVIADQIGTLDLYVGFCYLAKRDCYSKPTLCLDHSKLILTNSFHPVVYSMMSEHSYVKNSIELNNQSKQVIITGANMAGKSTIMRQIALSAILNQIGCYVPCTSATLPIFDNIYSRIGASDDLISGQSTFMVEMLETADILNRSSSKSLVIIDELGRGTSTKDGLAIAQAVLFELTANIQAWVFFATHFHQITKFAESFKSIKLLSTEILTKQDKISFTYKFISGECSNSYGIETAKLAGIKPKVIKKAQDYLKDFIKKERLSDDNQHNQLDLKKINQLKHKTSSKDQKFKLKLHR